MNDFSSKLKLTLLPFCFSPAWFNSVRALMLLSVFGSGFGVIFYITAFVTDNSKATGSRYWPSALVMFFGGENHLCIFIWIKIELFYT